MSRNTWKNWLACGLVTAAPWLVRSATAQVAAPEATRTTRIVTGPNADVVLAEGPAETSSYSEYWLGITLAPLPDVAKEQLGVEHGLVVAEVGADDPAAKAGVKKLDILTKAGDQSLKEPADLIKAVDAAKETELTLAVVRGGKELTIKVTPIKRPVTRARYTLRAPTGEIREEIKRLEEALQSLKMKAGGESLGLFFARPGVVAPQYALPKAAELPKGMSLSITKEADKPVKIHVKKDDKEWDVTDDKLDELPADVRKEVEKAIQGMSVRGIAAAARGFVGGPKIAPLAPGAVPAVPAPPLPPATGSQNKIYSYRVEAGGSSLEGKLDTIMKKLDELRKDVDNLRAKK
jgi:membrane-associated protease RseP (regulator of RpoE activity)